MPEYISPGTGTVYSLTVYCLTWPFISNELYAGKDHTLLVF